MLVNDIENNERDEESDSEECDWTGGGLKSSTFINPLIWQWNSWRKLRNSEEWCSYARIGSTQKSHVDNVPREYNNWPPCNNAWLLMPATIMHEKLYFRLYYEICLSSHCEIDLHSCFLRLHALTSGILIERMERLEETVRFNRSN